MQPRVSVVIAAYRTRPDYFEAALRSATLQTVADLEIIVGDDSPDDSLKSIVDRVADQRVRYRHNRPAAGTAVNHWTSFQEARGTYIVILNHDDVLAPQFAERMVAAIDDNPETVLGFCDHWVIDVDGKQLTEESDSSSRRWGRSSLRAGVHRPFIDLLASQAVPMAMGTLFRRTALPRSLPAHAGAAYDLWLTYLLSRQGFGAHYVPERLSSWRTHPSSQTAASELDWAVGSAACWDAVRRDTACASIQPLATRKAAAAFRSCSRASWRKGRLAKALWYGLRSMGVPLDTRMPWRHPEGT